MLLGILNYLRGNVRIEMRGACIERLLNICAFNGIDFWDLERIDADLVYATVRISGFRKLRKYSRRTMTKIKITKRRGVPFLVFRYRWRYALWGGALLSAAFLYFLTSFVWTIEVVGCSHTTPVQILSALNDLGLKTGVFKRSVDPTELKNEMLLKVDKLSWIAINIKGTNAEVIIREREETPFMIPKNDPCDIVAGKTGVIYKMNVKEGKALFTPGQTVVKGDMLVTGTIVSEKEAGVRYVHSLAEVQARTWYTLSGSAPETYLEKKYTGNKKIRKALIFGDKRINLYLNSGIPFDFCDKIIKKEKVIVNDNMHLPVAVVTETYLEYVPKKAHSRSGEVSTAIKRALEKQLKEDIQGGTIRSSVCTNTLQNDVVTVTLHAECIEEIALEKELNKEWLNGVQDAPLKK
ncbi:MAG: sporulation protein YqfD [Clostridiales bacterium]|nr:sporulation protein YqfD [Clostridiales bacterium]